DEAGAAGLEIRLGLDAGAVIAPRLGIECTITGSGEPLRQRTELHALLLRHGLALPAELAALDGWWGLAHERVLKAAWPAGLDAHPQRPSPAHRGVLARSEHHAKVTVEADGGMSAKLYLGVRLLWLEDRAMAAMLRAAAG